MNPQVLDTRERPLQELRISVTDRCNFRCTYCMPRHRYGYDFQYLPHSALLNFAEITRLARLFVLQGVRKIRLTGGEPLLRKHLENLIAQLRALPPAPHQERALELALTTNGVLLSQKAQALRAAGLDRLTVSLDALDDRIFRAMNDANYPVAKVLEGLNSAQQAGFTRIKINTVVKKGCNDDQVLPLLRHFMGQGCELRFIEFMDVGSSNAWCMDAVLPTQVLIAQLARHYRLEPLPAGNASATAQRYRAWDSGASARYCDIGFISSVTQAFCAHCNRVRLSTDGKLYTCLFASQGHDLRSLLRSQASDEAVQADIQQLWQGRSDHYSELRSQGRAPRAKRIEMHYIGG